MAAVHALLKISTNYDLFYCEINYIRVFSGSLQLMSKFDETIKHNAL